MPSRLFHSILVGLLLLNFVGCAPAATAVPATETPTAVPPTSTPIAVPDGWTLVWNDEFDGDTINASNWTYDLGGGGWGNGEAQIYTDLPENARVENGLLIIEARKETNENGGANFTSARLKTQGLQTFQYGYIEARIKVPAGKGLWPAFWMLGSNFPQVGWPDSGEIDIMEYVGRETDFIIGTMHGPGYAGAVGLSKWNRQEFNIADDFHTYAVEWDANQISWYFDGEKYSTYTREDVGPTREWVFDQPFFLILNLAIGGTLGGLVVPETPFPAQYQVDYVRVYQKAP